MEKEIDNLRMRKLEVLEASGVDMKSLSRNMNLSYLCADMASIYAHEVDRMLKKADSRYLKQDKKRINDMKRIGSLLTNSIDKILGDEMAEGFGDLSDFLVDVLEIVVSKCKSHESQLKLLSTLKMFKDE